MIYSTLNNLRYQFRFKNKFNKKFNHLPNKKGIADSYVKGIPFVQKSDLEHLHATMSWLATAHDVCKRKGASSKFDIFEGWGSAYPETSGYIINTFLTYSELFNEVEYRKRAIELGDWEISIQREDGAVFSNMQSKNVRVFNTGQVMLGWLELFEVTNEKKYLDACVRAAEYLIGIQEAGGEWEKDTHCGARTYETRVSWVLLRLGKLISEDRFIKAAQKNTDWVLQQFTSNGWIKNCGFYDNDPITHVLDYTLRGLLEIYSLNGDSDIVAAVENSLNHLIKSSQGNFVNDIDGMLAGGFSRDWVPDTSSSCLTGTAQFGYTLYRYNQIKNNKDYIKFADSLIDAVKSTQLIDTGCPEIDGAVPGCFPFVRGYCHNQYPNWAAKFFADALMIRIFSEKSIIVKS